jgi:two-component system, sensor histidine kinase and response regulator
VSFPFDRPTVLSRFGGDVSLLQEVAAIFRDSSLTWLGEMHELARQGEAEQLRRKAHTIKGSAGNFLAADTIAAALRVESLARAGDLQAAAEALPGLEVEVHRLHAALDEFLRELGS